MNLRGRLKDLDIDLLSPPETQVFTEDQWRRIAWSAELSERETEVCRQLMTGMTRREIAHELAIKPRTVRHHIEQIQRKLATTNRVGIALRVIQVRDQLERQDS